MRADENSSVELVALVGAPNSGKTTLYNWLTNSKFKTVNYPGATIEYSMGQLSPHFGGGLVVMDTPGTYSLFPKSADEEVTLKALYNEHQTGRVSKVIVVVDGTQMGRHLILVKQLKEAGFPFVIALTMSDLLQKQNVQVQKQIIEKEYEAEVVLIDGLLAGGVSELVEKIRQLKSSSAIKKLQTWSSTALAHNTQRCEVLAQEALGRNRQIEKIYDRTARLDRWLLHPVAGLFIFFAIMATLFSSIYWAAAPFMDWIDLGFSKLAGFVLELGPDTLWADFISHGVIGSFGAVFVFVPQIFILFLGIGILESSGYLARAATLVDKPFSKLGLSGRSFVPILSGFACAVPAMMATRNISSARDRWITNFVIPLMACSARLPVYSLLLGFLFVDQPAWKAGLSLAALYMGALVIGAIAAGIVNKIISKYQKGFFMMELPLYRRPRARVLLQHSWMRTKAYVKRAGPAIFIFAVIIWVTTTFPNYQLKDDHERLQTSYMGQMGQVVEPLFKPMGVDWRVGVGLISAFAAREVFVSSLAIVFNVANEDEDSQTQGLMKSMNEATFADGQKIFTTASVLGLILFFMIALQCMSTVAVAVRESGSWKYALTQLVVFNLVAYILAVVLVHGLRAVGVA